MQSNFDPKDIPQDMLPHVITFMETITGGAIAMVKTTERGTDKPVILLCAAARDGDEVTMRPFARLESGDPFVKYDPPEGAQTAEVDEGRNDDDNPFDLDGLIDGINLN